MKQPQKNIYDVIIIGAGISGLVCGCYLAKAGMKIIVVEQHDKPGGYCTSFTRRGFTFDAAAHSFGSYREGGNFRKILQELGVDTMINIKRFDPSDIIVTPDFKITFWNDINRTINNLIDIFPSEKNNIKKYYDYYNSLTSATQFEHIKLKDKSFESILRSFFSDNILINTIAFPVLGNGGLPPSIIHAFTGTKIFREFMLDGGYYPDGGMQKIPNALDSIIKQNSGILLYKRRAKKIHIENNTAIGIELDNNDHLFSKYVIAAGDMTETFVSLVGEQAVGSSIITKLRNTVPSISTFILYIGIDKPFTGLPEEGTNIWYLPYYDLDKMFNSIKECSLSNFGGGGYMLRVSPDKKTILAFCITAFNTHSFWKQHKKTVAEDFLNRIEKIIPNLKKHIVYFDAATPSTLHKYTLNHDGANYGWAPSLSQLFDPDFRQKSPISGLYMTGHWTAQTHGIPGVAYLGYNTAKQILNKMNMGIP
jgi:phytoene dehydrogenase-like protein